MLRKWKMWEGESTKEKSEEHNKEKGKEREREREAWLSRWEEWGVSALETPHVNFDIRAEQGRSFHYFKFLPNLVYFYQVHFSASFFTCMDWRERESEKQTVIYIG